MITRFGEKIDRFRHDDRGSAIIVVLVTMTFLIVLASVLLYMSLFNIQMKQVDKSGKANYYSAEAAMDQVRAGVQSAVSEAIKTAYSGVLVSYKTKTLDEQTSAFHGSFMNDLVGNNLLTAVAQDTYTYNLDTIRSYALSNGTLYTAQDGTVYINLPNTAKMIVSGSGTVEPADGGDGYVLKQVSIKYLFKGYETSVTSDIKIKTPDLPYTSTSMTQSSAPDFSIIAKGHLQQPAGGGNITVSGSVYGGDLTIGGSGDVLNIRNTNDFVLNGDVSINGGTLTTDMSSPLWAKSIILDAAARISLAGDVFISNDLTLQGSGTQATLSGRYFGYGNSTTYPDSSSAIIINGMNTVLDMSALRALLLAGNSYVNYGTGDLNGYVKMGESISVKSNQLAYLVPDTCLSVTNPYPYVNDPGNAALLANVNLNQVFMNGKTLNNYGITSTANIQLIYKNVGDTHLVYFCLKFPSTDMANAYFKDYYASNKAVIQKYLDLYTNGVLLSGTATKNLAGEAFTFNGTTLSDTIIDANGVPAASIDGITSNYNNLRVTLSRTAVDTSGAATAYDYYVDSAQMNGLNGVQVYALNSVPKVLVTNGGCTIDDTMDSNIHIVIASGNVIVQRDYSGLIIAGGTVTLNNNVTADRAKVSEALQALMYYNKDDKKNEYYFLNPAHISPFNSNGSVGSDDVWNMNVLVTYQNWGKNAA